MKEKKIVQNIDNSEDEIILKLSADIAAIIKNSGLKPQDFEDVEDMGDLDYDHTPFSEISKKIIPAVFKDAQNLIFTLWKMHANQKIIGKFDKFFIQIYHDEITTHLNLSTRNISSPQPGIALLTRSDSILNLIESAKTLIQYEFDSDFTGRLTTYGKRKCYTGNLQNGICLESDPTQGLEIHFWMPKNHSIRRRIVNMEEFTKKIRNSLEKSNLSMREIAGQIGISVSTLKKAKKDIKLVGYRSAVKIIRYLYGKDLYIYFK